MGAHWHCDRGFGFAIGRFVIAIRQFMQIEGRANTSTGFTAWFGAIAIVFGVLLTLAGLVRYRLRLGNRAR